MSGNHSTMTGRIGLPAPQVAVLWVEFAPVDLATNWSVELTMWSRASLPPRFVAAVVAAVAVTAVAELEELLLYTLRPLS